MNEIHALIKCLTSREWESFQKYLTCFSTHANCPEGLKQLQLARILRESAKPLSEEKCSLKIYGIKNEQSFEMLKSRLRKKALDFLLTDISCDKKQELDEADLAIIEMKKKSAQFQQLYYSKNRNDFFYSLLDEIILLAKKYEQYSILTDHLRIKKTLIAWKKGHNEYNQINEDIKKYMLYDKNCSFSEHFYYELMMLNDYNGKKKYSKSSINH